MDVNDLWNYFKNSTTDSIKKNTPTKSIGNKTTLPWVTPQIKKLINKKNKLFKNSGISVFASDEKAAWNCLFKILAFSVGSACKTPSLLRGVILLFSFFPAFYIGVQKISENRASST
jgi:hypothetical protein